MEIFLRQYVHRHFSFSIIESQNGFNWKGSLKIIEFQHSCHLHRHLPLDQVPQGPNLSLNISRDGTSTSSLANLFHYLTTPIVKNFFLLSNLDLLPSSLKLLPLVLSLSALVKSPSPSFMQDLLRHWKAAVGYPVSLLFSRLNIPSWRGSPAF